MNLKTTSIVSAVAACVAMAAMPVTSEAKASGNAAVDACVKSFVATYLPGRTVRPVKYISPAPGPIALYWAPRDFTVLLSAHGVDSGELVAEARCVASRAGTVIVLDQPDLAREKVRADFVVALR